MILTRAPLSVPLGGEGTDFPSYYLNYGGFVLGFAIDKYVHVALNETIDWKIRVKSSLAEEVDNVDELHNRVAAEALKYYGITKGIEVVTFSDLPEDSGIGSSSAFCVALVSAIRCLLDLDQDKEIIFSDAYQIERVEAGKLGGMQDPWFSSYGGVHCLELGRDDRTKSRSIDISYLVSKLKLVYTGTSSRSSSIVDRQARKIRDLDDSILDSLAEVKSLGLGIESAIREGSLDRIGRIFTLDWLANKESCSKVVSGKVEALYNQAERQDVEGGKLLGLGGGSYLLFYSSNGWKPEDSIDFGIDNEGVKVVYKS